MRSPDMTAHELADMRERCVQRIRRASRRWLDASQDASVQWQDARLYGRQLDRLRRLERCLSKRALAAMAERVAQECP